MQQKLDLYYVRQVAQVENKMKKYTMEELTEAIEHLAGAHEVMKDKDLMAAVKEKMKGMSKIKSIQDIREAASESQIEEEEVHDKGIEKVPPKMAGEDKEKHVKNSDRPTVVGKAMK
jgi:hypothetical protein